MNTHLIKFLIVVIALSYHTRLAHADTDLLPHGIGAYQAGYRGFFPQTHRYNSSGKRELLSAPFNQEFSGQNLVNGSGGADLQSLAGHIQRFDSYSEDPDSLVNSLYLGSMRGEVLGSVSATFFGLAYGASPNLTLSLGVPYVRASVTADIDFVGDNNAHEIKSRLGEAAFAELKDGLDEASKLNADRIKASFLANGYQPIESWQHQGLGDIKIGATYGFERRLKGGLLGRSAYLLNVNLPTGYVEDPDILTDFSIGKGYYGISNALRQTIILPSSLWFRGQGMLGLNLPTSMEKRVPEGTESVVAPERKARVDMQPGQDIGASFATGFNLSVLKPSYEISYTRHFKDRYDGSLQGNYDALADGSSSMMLSHTLGLILQTADLYNQGRFPIPLIISAAMKAPITAVNSSDERYYEVSIASFFQTGIARSNNRVQPKRQQLTRKSRGQGERQRRQPPPRQRRR